MVFHDPLGQRQAEPRPPRVTLTALLQAGEAFEHLLALVDRHARTVIAHGEHHPRPLFADRDRDPLTAVTRRVVEQVAHHAGQLIGVAPHPTGRHARQIEVHRCHPCALGEDQLVEVDVGTATEPALLQPSHGEQVPDQVIQAIVFGQHGRRDRRPVDVVGVAQRRLELRADGRDRRSQLMARVGDELALLDRRLLQAVEHVVHRDGQERDLVLGRRDRHPSVEVRAAQLTHPPSHHRDGSERLTGDDPRHRAGGEHQHRQAEPQRGAQRTNGPVDLAERRHGVDREVAPLGLDRPGGLHRLVRIRQGRPNPTEQHEPALAVDTSDLHLREGRAVQVEVRRRDHLLEVTRLAGERRRHLIVQLAFELGRRREQLGRHAPAVEDRRHRREHTLVAGLEVVGERRLDPLGQQRPAAEQRHADDEDDRCGQAEPDRVRQLGASSNTGRVRVRREGSHRCRDASDDLLHTRRRRWV